MSRGDLVTVAVSGDYGKPRPALVIQSDHYDKTESLTVLLITSTLVDAPLVRQTIEPTPVNGLRRTSQVQLDRSMTLQRTRIGPTIGRLDDETMLSVSRKLAVFLGIA